MIEIVYLLTSACQQCHCKNVSRLTLSFSSKYSLIVLHCFRHLDLFMINLRNIVIDGKNLIIPMQLPLRFVLSDSKDLCCLQVGSCLPCSQEDCVWTPPSCGICNLTSGNFLKAKSSQILMFFVFEFIWVALVFLWMVS